MSLFDLLFIAVFLASVGSLLGAALLAVRGYGAKAVALLGRWCICAVIYLSVVVLASAFWPRKVLQLGGQRCFDDWCIAVESVSHQPAQDGGTCRVTLRLSSRARRVTQRENNVVVYLTDRRGRRYDPIPDKSAGPMNVQLAPQESVQVMRNFAVPADVIGLGLVIDHEGGFPIGWFIIGDEAWFHKPTIVQLH